MLKKCIECGCMWMEGVYVRVKGAYDCRQGVYMCEQGV